MDAEDLDRRFAYHPARDEGTRNAHADVRTGCLDLAGVICALVPDGREKALAVTKLEEVMMWANAGIARSSPVPEGVATVSVELVDVTVKATVVPSDRSPEFVTGQDSAAGCAMPEGCQLGCLAACEYRLTTT